MPEFGNLRKKVRRRRVETILLIGYAFAVTCALFLSLLSKSGTNSRLPIQHYADENYNFGSDVLTPAFEDSSRDNPFELASEMVYNVGFLSSNSMITQKLELVQNAHREAMITINNKSEYDDDKQISGIYQKERHVLMIEQGDTFIGILTKQGMDTKTATDAYNVLKRVFDARNLRVGQYITLTATYDVQSRQLETLDRLIFEPERGTKYILSINEYDKFESKVEREKFASDVREISGNINGQTLSSLIKAGVPQRVANETINRFTHIINFKTDVHKGDSFIIKYDVSKAANGDVVRIGGLLSAKFVLGKQQYQLYRYKNDFYNEKGEAKKTGLDIKPLAQRNARISSLYGYRRHPIYKTQKFHNGVDYAAPSGTAIYASGNGVIEMAQYVNGYGNFVKIRHNSEYETAYGHMKGFASGIRKGVRVRKGQIIGYVGSTGRSTGPHLHFEILRKGQRINPLKAQVATGNDLTGNQLAEFKRTIKQIDAMHETIDKKVVALAPAPKLETAAASSDIPGNVQMLPDSSKLTSKEKDTTDSLDENNVALTLQIEQTSVVASTENKLVQSNNPEHENTEITNDNTKSEEKSVSVITYKGKLLYPPRITANEARLKKVKFVQLPTKKPLMKNVSAKKR